MQKPKIFGINLSLPQLLLLLVIVAAVLILPGLDIYTHIHDSWLYNKMLKDRVILTEDSSMLGGHESVYGYGVPSYILAGFAWFFFQKAAIDVLEVALFAGLVLISLSIFKNKNMLFTWYALIFIKILLPDSFPYLLSIFLFYLGVYLIRRYKDKPFGDLAILLAGLNHPYAALTNVVTLFFGRTRLFLCSIAVLAVQIVLLKFIYFYGLVNFDFYNLLELAIRSLVMLFPFIISLIPKLSAKARIFSLRSAYALVLAGIFIIYPLFFVPFGTGWKDAIRCYYKETYSEVPSLPGNVRIVDNCREWIYAFPLRGMVTSISPAFQGQYYDVKWTESKYFSYLNMSKTTWVVFCRDCDFRTPTLEKTGELQILQKNFPLYANVSDFEIFDVRDAVLLVSNSKTKQHHQLNSTMTRIRQIFK